MTVPTPSRLRACPCCGLVHTVPDLDRTTCACCVRCGTTLRRAAALARSNARTVAIALAALVLYPFAVTMPIMTIEQFGHIRPTSILGGVTALLSGGHLFVGAVVLLCSIVLPLGKLFALLTLAAGGAGLHRRHRALTYHIVEWTGRWGMLDVTLVAVLVAALKLGDLVEVRVGPAAWTFALVVGLSLLATATFDPHRHWETESS